jgi:hypothetical protein
VPVPVDGDAPVPGVVVVLVVEPLDPLPVCAPGGAGEAAGALEGSFEEAPGDAGDAGGALDAPCDEAAEVEEPDVLGVDEDEDAPTSRIGAGGITSGRGRGTGGVPEIGNDAPAAPEAEPDAPVEALPLAA